LIFFTGGAIAACKSNCSPKRENFGMNFARDHERGTQGQEKIREEATP
jgi:hypothetical protein